MALDARNHPHPALSRNTGRGDNTIRQFIAVALPPFVIACALTTACYLAAGTGLMLYLGGLALAMVLTPPLTLMRESRLEQILAAGSIADGVGVVWLVAMFQSETTFGQWLSAYVLLVACIIAAAGVAVALSRWVMRELFASAVVVMIALAWLTWPIWLSGWIDRPSVVRAIDWLVPVHPLLALNGLLAHLGVWGEQRLMYQLTSLGQDVPYAFPSTIAPATLAHLLLGGALLLLARGRGAGDVGPTIDIPDRQPG